MLPRLPPPLCRALRVLLHLSRPSCRASRLLPRPPCPLFRALGGLFSSLRSLCQALRVLNPPMSTPPIPIVINVASVIQTLALMLSSGNVTALPAPILPSAASAPALTLSNPTSIEPPLAPFGACPPSAQRGFHHPGWHDSLKTLSKYPFTQTISTLVTSIDSSMTCLFN